MRDLLVQAASTGAQDAAARADTAAELTQLKQELDRIARTTSFAGIPLLDGTYSRDFQVGADAGDTLHVTIGTGPLDAAGLGLAGIGTTGGTAIAAAVTPAITADQGTPRQGWVTLAGDYVDDATAAAVYGALQGTVTWNGRTVDLGSVDYTGAVTAQDHLDRLDAAVMAAWGTVHTPVVATATGLMFDGDPPGPASTSADVVPLTPSYAGATGPSSSLGLVDAAIGRVSSLRAYLGAVDNRFSHTVARLGVTGEDTSASLSRIEDADVATEVSALSRSQVLTQATTALLAQAHQTAQSVLDLLG
jgi:flagellin